MIPQLMFRICQVLLNIFILAAVWLILKQIDNKLKTYYHHPYVALQTEEPLNKGDSLMVLDVSPDTIWIGYLH